MKSVLIVDDREDDLYLLRVLLEAQGLDVVSATNGEDALKIARKHLPDIIISDIMMPVMDGFRLCREWMADERLQTIPFVFYTATYTETKDEEFALSLGATRFIVKPTEPDEFMNIIEGILRELHAGEIENRTPTVGTGDELLRLYDERLVNMLEKKTLALEKEIIERIQAEENLNKVSRLYATLSQINQAIVRASDKNKLFQEICNIAIEFGRFRLAWIGLLDEEQQLVKPVVVSGKGSDYLQNIHISLTDDISRNGPTGRAIREGKGVVFNDLKNNPDFAPWREQAIEKGYRSSGAFPIRLNNDVIGALNVYAVEADFFDQGEIKLLEEMALDISFALDKFNEEENRRQAEEGLERSGVEWSNAMDFFEDAVFLIDMDDRVVRVNRAFTQLTGLTSEQAIGQNIISIIHPERGADRCPVCRARHAREDAFVTMEADHPDNSTGLPIEVMVSIVRNKAGEPLSVLMGIHDLTRQRKEQEELRQANLIVENSPVVLFRWKATDGWPVELVSDNVAQFGYTPDELLSGETPFTSMLHPDDRQQVAHQVQEYTSSGLIHFQQEYRIVTRSGDIRWVDDRTTVERDADGNICHYQGIVIDITERRRNQDMLVASEERYRSFIENTSEGIYSFETDIPVPVTLPVDEQIKRIYQGHVVACNDALAHMYGYPDAKSMMGITLGELHGGDDKPENIAFISEWIKAGYRISDAESNEVDKNGHQVWFSNAVVGVVENDMLVRIWGSQTDITERKQDEAKLATQLDELRRWHNATLGREGRMLELKREVNRLLIEQGQSPRYSSVAEEKSGD